MLNVTEPEFFSEVERQLKTRGADDWKTYLRWHAAHNRAPYLSAAFVKEDFDFFSKHLNGVLETAAALEEVRQAGGPRTGRCIGTGICGTDLHGRREGAGAWDAESDREGDGGGSQTIAVDERGHARKRALEKLLRAMVNKIGYPDKWRDYTALSIVPGDFAGNVQRTTEFESRRQLAKIGKPVDRKEWFMTPPMVDAYYNPQTNDMNFPAGVLQPPLFDLKLDDAPNYGNTGGTITELTHGFDDEGRQFDAKGNLKDWWTKQDAAEFMKRATCISDQYSQYTVVDEVKINGKLTLGEDVADLGGLILAYNAWKSATAAKKLEPIDGYTPEQRFFLGFAQWDCGEEIVREQAGERDHESAFAGRVSNQRSGEQHGGVRQGVLLQDRAADGARRRVPDLVEDNASIQRHHAARLCWPPGASPLLRGQSLLREHVEREVDRGFEGSARRSTARIPFSQDVRTGGAAREVRGPCERRQPVSVVRQRAASGMGPGARGPVPLAV